MKRIKITNFRKIKDSCEIELGPITFFTGPNNSGKSTILKALMILSDYGKSSNHLELNFRGENKWGHKIDCYQNATNWNNFKNGNHKIEFNFDNSGYQTTIIFRPLIQTFKKIDKVQNGLLESINIKRTSNSSTFTMHHVDEDKFQLTIDEKFLENKRIDSSQEIEFLETTKNRIEKLIERIEADLDSENDTRIEIRKREELTKQKQRIKEVNAKIKELFGEKEESKDSLIFKPIFEIQDLQDGILVLDRIVNMSLVKYFKDNEKEVGYSDNRNVSFSLMRMSDKITNAINFSVEHLSPHRNSQTRLYINDENSNDIYDLIGKHSQRPIKKTSKAGEFLKKWMRNFDIGDDYKIRSVEGIASIVEIIEGDNEINLVDKGFGAGQIFAILLCIALKIDERENANRNLTRRIASLGKETIIMIEEPEANLHPALQSKLTELFLDAYKRFGIRFIIETHSEYIIRHSQYLSLKEGFAGKPFKDLAEDMSINHSINSLGNERFSGNPFKVYYFPKDKDPYEMEYTADGRFNNNFGSGFFDHATKSTMETLKLSRKK